MLPSTCSKVSLRQRPIKNDRLSLYLDYYPAIRNPRTMKMSRREYLGFESDLEPEYYTMPEAMARYNMTRDQISHYVRAHDIPRSYEGRYVRIDRKALDALFAPPKIG